MPAIQQHTIKQLQDVDQEWTVAQLRADELAERRRSVIRGLARQGERQHVLAEAIGLNRSRIGQIIRSGEVTDDSVE